MSESSERVAILFTGITACFSYEGYRYNKEKFRLELFEKRWEIYKVLTEISRLCDGNQIWTDGSETDKTAYVDCGKKFLDIKVQNYLVLFGADVGKALSRVDYIYKKVSSGNIDFAKEDVGKLNKELADFFINCPDIFSPYLYFGNYKSPQPTPHKNLCELCVLCGEKISLTIAQIKKFITCSKT